MPTLDQHERLLVEALDTLLQHDVQLGLKPHAKQLEALGKAERGYEYLHGQIDEMFALKAAQLTFADSACQAFNKVHTYKYLDDESFPIAMEKELIAQGIPAEERKKAVGFIPAIIEELAGERDAWAEKDAGFNPKMSEIVKLSKPQQYE